MNGSLFKVVALSEVLMLIIALSVYKYLPAEVPVHWDMNGEPNNYFPRLLACFAIPIFTILLALFFVYTRKKENMETDGSWYIEYAVLFLLVMVHTSTLVLPLFHDVSVVIPVSIIVGSFFCMVGNFIPKANNIIPEKKRFSSFEVAKKCGYFTMFMGLLMLVTPLILNVESFFFLTLYLIIFVLGTIHFARKSLSKH